MLPVRSSASASSETLKATAHVPARPASSVAVRASRMPSRATSIQCAGPGSPGRARAALSDAARIDQVFVEITSQPAST